MKTRKMLTWSAMMGAALLLGVTACQKDSKDEGSSDTSSLQQLSKDEATMENASDEALNDANAVLSGGGAAKSTLWMPCNATIDSTTVQNDTITYHITYNGLNCNGKVFRTGQVEVKRCLTTHWFDPGATVIVNMFNFKVTRVLTGKSVMLNGTKTFVNVSGGRVADLGNGTVTSVVHRISGNLAVTFDDSTTRTWTVARQRTYTGTAGQLEVTSDGFGSSGNYSNLVTWGVNRNGEEFYSQITTSVVVREACDWDPCTGVVVHQVPAHNKKATVTFGFDDNNQPVVPPACPTRFRIDWERNGHSGTIFLQLP